MENWIQIAKSASLKSCTIYLLVLIHTSRMQLPNLKVRAIFSVVYYCESGLAWGFHHTQDVVWSSSATACRRQKGKIKEKGLEENYVTDCHDFGARHSFLPDTETGLGRWLSTAVVKAFGSKSNSRGAQSQHRLPGAAVHQCWSFWSH